MKWKDISTSPKDGIIILVSGYLYEEKYGRMWFYTEAFNLNGIWYKYLGEIKENTYVLNPTKWMEIPKRMICQKHH